MNTFFASEEALVAFLQKQYPLPSGVGIGDDAAVIPFGQKELVVTTDCLVENVHFKAAWAMPRYLGRKAAISNCSDLAAMGAQPLYALVSLILPQSIATKHFVGELYRGFADVFARLPVHIIGGNFTQGQEISITLTLIGAAEGRVLKRSTAHAGDIFCVTGELGLAAQELQLLLKGKIKQAAYVPASRVLFARLLTRANIATSCIDISDGFAKDLHRLCVASEVGAIIYNEQLPGNKLGLFGGEDYELLFTVKKGEIAEVFSLAEKTETPISVIGEVKSKRFGIQLVIGDRQEKLAAKGWDHVTHSAVTT